MNANKQNSDRVLYLDCHDGVAGDMILAALLDLGVPVDLVESELKKLELDGWELKVSEVKRNAIRALHLDVIVQEQHHHRSWADIRAMIEKSAIGDSAKKRGLEIFQALAAAEAKVHGVDVDKVHFHEVGAVDSIIDIVGTAVALDYLGADVISSKIPVGTGSVETAHGSLPVPAPATLEILRGVPVTGREEEQEFTTPTGAAVVKTQALRHGPFPSMIVLKTGYGAGTRSSEKNPGLLRAVLGKRDPDNAENTWIIETNLDDCTGEVEAYVISLLIDKGALDAWCTHAVMKKGRPAVVMSALVHGEDRGRLGDIMLSETSSIGIRFYPVQRKVLERNTVMVETQFGKIPVKVAGPADAPLNAAAEFEASKKAALEHAVSVKQVMTAAISAYWAGREKK